MIELLQSNALHIPLADKSVHMVVTSPPYWSLRDYGIANQLGLEKTPEEYCANMVAVFREVRRVLHPSGVVWLNLGDSYNGSGGAGGDYNEGGLKAGQPKYPGRNVSNLKPKDLVGIPWRVAFALQADGWWLRSAPPWIKNNPMPESCQDRPTTAHEYWYILTKKAHYYADADAVRGAHKTEHLSRYDYDFWPDGTKEASGGGRPDLASNTSGSKQPNPAGHNRRTSDFFYESLDHMIEQESSYLRHLKKVRSEGGMLLDQDDMPIALVFNTYAFKGAHFATFAPKMIEPIIKFSTSERGCCPECGGQWERITEKPKPPASVYTDSHKPEEIKPVSHPELGKVGMGQKLQNWYNDNPTTTLGWRPTCTCPEHEPVPSRVFDPFIGSGTTLQVARALGRNGIGIDLSDEYLHLARERLSLDKLDAWTKGARADGDEIGKDGHKNMNVPGRQPHSFHVARVKGDETVLDDLPMFQEDK